jgi:hypothetical protein
MIFLYYPFVVVRCGQQDLPPVQLLVSLQARASMYTNHRLTIELEHQSLFGLLCTAVLIG